MSLAAERYLIELGPASLPEPHYLHVYEVDGEARTDAGFDWSPDRAGALRFASRGDAEAFGRLNLDIDFLATAHPAADLVGAPHHDPEDEVYDLDAC